MPKKKLSIFESPEMFKVLLYLSNKPQTSYGLAKLMNKSHSTVYGQVKELNDSNYVQSEDGSIFEVNFEKITEEFINELLKNYDTRHLNTLRNHLLSIYGNDFIFNEPNSTTKTYVDMYVAFYCADWCFREIYTYKEKLERESLRDFTPLFCHLVQMTFKFKDFKKNDKMLNELFILCSLQKKENVINEIKRQMEFIKDEIMFDEMVDYE